MDLTPRLKELAVSDRGFLFDPFTGQTFNVNATGRFLLERLKEGVLPEALGAALAGAFETSPDDDPGRDAREFVQLLREHGLLPTEAR
jgi:predicted Rdx family selenoprotein